MTTTLFTRVESKTRVQYQAVVPDPYDLSPSNKIVLDGKTLNITATAYLNVAGGEELHIVAGGNLFWVDERDDDEVVLFATTPMFTHPEGWGDDA